MNGIQVKNLVKTYITQSTDIILNGAKRPSTTRTVLHGVSVDFPAGKLTAILGRSGCGKSTLLLLGYFVVPRVTDPDAFQAVSGSWLVVGLCLLLAFVGFGMGLEGKLKAMLRGAGLGIVLVPLAMVAGSLLAGVVYSLLSPMTLREGLAISAGFGWYTLAPSVISGAGHAVAGAVSFLHNVLRETLGIILLPLAASKIGCIEAVTLPGTCAMDVCLPIVERSCSAETLPYSFTTGMAACLFSALLVPLIMGV